MTSKYQEAQALFEQFLDEEETPDASAYLAKCPPEQREMLLRAFAALDGVFQFYTTIPEVRTDESEQLLSRIAAERRREALEERSRATGLSLSKVFLEDTKGRLAAARSWLKKDPVACMVEALNIAGIDKRIGVLQRGSSRGARQSEEWLRSQEQRVESVVTNLLGVSANSDLPTNLDLMADYIEVVVEKADLDPSIKVQGYFVTDGKVGGIVVNTNPELGKNTRQRFTYAHEVGHAVLHKDRGITAFQDHLSELNNYSDQTELEANLFASALLMPMPSMMHIYPPSVRPSFEHVQAVARQFRVSAQAGLRRVIRMSDYPCAFVVIRRGKIEWSVPSPHFEGSIRSGVDVPRNSLARQYVVQPNVGSFSFSEANSHPASWIDGVETFDSLYEESYQISEDYIYTILSLD